MSIDATATPEQKKNVFEELDRILFACPPKTLLVSSEALFHEDLNFSDAILLSLIHHCIRKDGCTESNEFFAKVMRMAPGSIKNSIAKLIRVGFLHREFSNNGTKRHLYTFGYLMQNRHSLRQGVK